MMVVVVVGSLFLLMRCSRLPLTGARGKKGIV
jgi:hypothetical protein